MVMELLDGGSLNQRLGFAPLYKGPTSGTFKFTKKKMSFDEALKYGRELADALRYCHDDAIPGKKANKMVEK